MSNRNLQQLIYTAVDEREYSEARELLNEYLGSTEDILITDCMSIVTFYGTCTNSDIGYSILRKLCELLSQRYYVHRHGLRIDGPHSLGYYVHLKDRSGNNG